MNRTAFSIFLAIFIIPLIQGSFASELNSTPIRYALFIQFSFESATIWVFYGFERSVDMIRERKWFKIKWILFKVLILDWLSCHRDKLCAKITLGPEEDCFLFFSFFSFYFQKFIDCKLLCKPFFEGFCAASGHDHLLHFYLGSNWGLCLRIQRWNSVFKTIAAKLEVSHIGKLLVIIILRKSTAL